MLRSVSKTPVVIAVVGLLLAGTMAGAQTAGSQTELAASHILIMHVGSARAPETVTRTKEEAETFANEIFARAKKGESFEELAKQYSDGPSAPRGGDLGMFPSGRMIPAFSEAVMKIEPGQITGPVETQFGFHIIRRNEVVKASARHILIMHKESARAPAEMTRTKEEALVLIEEVLVKARAEGADFAALAVEYSEGPSAPKGGDLGAFGRGAMVPAFDEAVFTMEPGEISAVVETPFGYHIIQRYE